MTKRKAKTEKPKWLLTSEHLDTLETLCVVYAARLDKLQWDVACLMPGPENAIGLASIQTLRKKAEALRTAVYTAAYAQFPAEQDQVGYVLKKIEAK